MIAAPPLTALEAVELNRRRRSLDASEEAALTRFELAKRWGLGAAAPSLELLQADRDGLADPLRLGWILTTPEALALVPEHDSQQIAALDPAGRPFEPDRLRVTLGSRIAALWASVGVLWSCWPDDQPPSPPGPCRRPGPTCCCRPALMLYND